MYVADLLSRNYVDVCGEEDMSMNEVVHVLSEYINEFSEEK